MQDILTAINEYCEQHSTPQDEILRQIERATHLETLSPRMLSGHMQGMLLTLISKMITPKVILEIGTFTGYSAVCLAKGLQSGGKLISIEYNEENAHLAKRLIDETIFKEQIDLRQGDAKEIIPTLDYTFDLVFIDADKDAYSLYYDLVIDKCRSGSIILADNVLWSGKVLDAKPDKKTASLMAFNEKIAQDSRVENVILPIRDGINLIRII
jgi:caffeoyl-CoA O-methyltransferase